MSESVLRWISLFIFFPFSLLAQMDTEVVSSASSSVASLEGPPSNLINNAVCFITGEYIDQAIDIILPGPEPLIIGRSYSSQDSYGNLGNYWSFNHHDKVFLNQTQKHHKNYLQLLLIQPSAARLAYLYPIEESEHDFNKRQKIEFILDLPKGLTNGGGRSNIKNQKAYFYPASAKIEVVDGSGSKRILKKGKRDKKTGLYAYYQVQENKLNGNCLLYKHLEQKVASICAANQNTELQYSSVHFVEDGNKEHPIIKLNTSAGKEVLYHFERQKYEVKTKKGIETRRDLITQYYLNKVELTDRPVQCFKYSKKADGKQQHISYKILPDHRFLKIDYYHEKSNSLGFLGTIKLKDDDYRLDRVKTLSAPSGVDQTPVVTHYFLYHAKQNDSKEILNGHTEVFNANLQKTTYYYNKEHQITEIEHFLGSFPHFTLYNKESYTWDDKEGNLLIKSIKDASGIIHYARQFAYDAFGNITHDSLFGRLTGQDASPIILRDNLSGAECYTKQYSYSQDGLNLLRVEKEPNGKTTHYGYKKGTNLLAHKFIKFEGKICIREFYRYNENAVLIKSIIDDGCTNDENNLSGVTERKITYFSPRQEAPFHLPLQIDEMYLDLNSGKEVLIKKICCSYDVEGHLLCQDHYDSLGAYRYSLTWEYNAHGKVTKEVNAIGESIFRSYDKNDNLILEKRPGHDVEYTYDFCNRLIAKKVHAANEVFVTTNQYDVMGQKIASVDSFGNETSFHYDDLGRLIKIKLPKVADESGTLVHYNTQKQYDLLGHVCSEIDAKGKKTIIARNIRGQPTHTIFPDSTQERLFYELDGSLARKVDKNGKIIQYTRDYLGRVVREDILAPNQKLIKTAYFNYSAFHLISSIDFDGLETTYTYDGAGRVIKTIKGDQEIEQSYDTLGRVEMIKEWFGPNQWRLHKKECDLLDRVIKETVENGAVQSLARYAYDAQGNQILVQKGESSTKTLYNARKQPVKITDALGNKTHIKYDNQFINDFQQRVLQTTITDPLGNQTIHTYDTLGRIVQTKRKNAFGVNLACNKIAYDANGNRISATERVYEGKKCVREIYTQWLYNDNNQKTFLIEAKDAPEQKITQYGYNACGQMDCIVKPNGAQIHSVYDAEGRLSHYFASDGSFDYVYKYNLSDQPIRIIDKKHKFVNERTYDIMGQLQTEKLSNNLYLSYAYDRVGRMTSLTLPDQSKIEYEYNAIHLKKILRLKEGSILYSHQEKTHNLSGLVTEEISIRNHPIKSSYDALGRLIEMTHNSLHQNIPSKGYDAAGNLLSYHDGNNTYTFSYDDLYQLKSEKGNEEHTYRYDSISNRLGKDKLACSVNALNQILSQGSESYVYDANGNLVEKKAGSTTYYHYDALDRLISVEWEGKTIHYIYDSFNRRIAKKQAGKPDQYFIYQGQQEIGLVENDKIKELKVIKPGKRGHSIAIELEDIIYEPVHDIFGNIIGIDGVSGTEVYRYTAFGEESTTDALSPWRYADRRKDKETGFVAFGLRYYYPATGSWTAADPLGDEDGPNLYAYVHASPLVYFDAMGLMADYPFPLLYPSNSTPNIISAPNFEPFMGLFGILDLRRALFDGDASHLVQEPRNFDLNLDFLELGFDQPPFLKEDRNHRFGFCNGIDNTFPDFRSTMKHFNQLIPGYNLHGTYCPTRDIVRDGLRYFLTTFCNIGFGPIPKLHEMWDNFFDHADPTACFFQICHSWGAANVRNALMIYAPDRRKRIEVLAIAPGAYIDRELCKDVWHYVCTSDIVPKIDQIGKAKAIQQGTIYYLDDPDGSHFSLKRHSVTDKIYMKAIREHTNKYLRS